MKPRAVFLVSLVAAAWVVLACVPASAQPSEAERAERDRRACDTGNREACVRLADAAYRADDAERMLSALDRACSFDHYPSCWLGAMERRMRGNDSAGLAQRLRKLCHARSAVACGALYVSGTLGEVPAVSADDVRALFGEPPRASEPSPTSAIGEWDSACRSPAGLTDRHSVLVAVLSSRSGILLGSELDAEARRRAMCELSRDLRARDDASFDVSVRGLERFLFEAPRSPVSSGFRWAKALGRLPDGSLDVVVEWAEGTRHLHLSRVVLAPNRLVRVADRWTYLGADYSDHSLWAWQRDTTQDVDGDGRPDVLVIHAQTTPAMGEYPVAYETLFVAGSRGRSIASMRLGPQTAGRLDACFERGTDRPSLVGITTPADDRPSYEASCLRRYRFDERGSAPAASLAFATYGPAVRVDGDHPELVRLPVGTTPVFFERAESEAAPPANVTDERGFAEDTRPFAFRSCPPHPAFLLVDSTVRPGTGRLARTATEVVPFGVAGTATSASGGECR